MISRILFLLTLLLLATSTGFGQVERLMYDSIPHYKTDTIPVFHDYNKHMFFGYDDCTEYTALKYGFVYEYHGRLRRISYAIMRYDWLNRRWSKQMRRRNGPNWVEAYYQDLRDCRDNAIFQRFTDDLSDSTFTRIKGITSKEQLLRITPLDFLRYLATSVTMTYGRTADGQSVLLETRRDTKFLITPKDNWVKKSDVASLIQFIYSQDDGMRRACLCADTVLQGQPTTVGTEAFKLIALYRGHDYPTSFPTVSRAEADELFRWWLEERKKP